MSTLIIYLILLLLSVAANSFIAFDMHREHNSLLEIVEESFIYLIVDAMLITAIIKAVLTLSL